MPSYFPENVVRVTCLLSRNPIDPPFLTVESLMALNFVCAGFAQMNEPLHSGGELELRAYNEQGHETGSAHYQKNGSLLELITEEGTLAGFLDQHAVYRETQ